MSKPDPILSGRADAERAAALALELNLLLSGALVTQDDGTEVVDIRAWKNAGIPQVLPTTRNLISLVLGRLDR